MSVPELTSGDLARATGNTVRTIRFYEEEGLLHPAVVSDGGHRRYTETDLDRLTLIGDLRELGLSLCEIREVLDLRKGCSCVAEFASRLDERLSTHVDEARRRIERMERVRKEIERALVLIHGHMDGRTSPRPCDHTCGPDAPKILRVLAPKNTDCVLHESGDDQRVEPEPAPVVQGWVNAAAAGKR
jgi:DNA-binding transcriptional MerR regulator